MNDPKYIYTLPKRGGGAVMIDLRHVEWVRRDKADHGTVIVKPKGQNVDHLYLRSGISEVAALIDYFNTHFKEPKMKTPPATKIISTYDGMTTMALDAANITVAWLIASKTNQDVCFLNFTEDLGGGETRSHENIKLHNDKAQEVQAWLNDHGFAAEHQHGVSRWIKEFKAATAAHAPEAATDQYARNEGYDLPDHVLYASVNAKLGELFDAAASEGGALLRSKDFRADFIQGLTYSVGAIATHCAMREIAKAQVEGAEDGDDDEPEIRIMNVGGGEVPEEVVAAIRSQCKNIADVLRQAEKDGGPFGREAFASIGAPLLLHPGRRHVLPHRAKIALQMFEAHREEFAAAVRAMQAVSEANGDKGRVENWGRTLERLEKLHELAEGCLHLHDEVTS